METMSDECGCRHYRTSDTRQASRQWIRHRRELALVAMLGVSNTAISALAWWSIASKRE